MALAAGPLAQGGTGRAMGLLGSMSAVGTALGPALGGLLLAGPGWRAVFAAVVPAALLAFFLARRLADDAPAQACAPAPLVPLALLRDPVLASGFAMTALAMALMIATMLVGPFYLGRALGLLAGGVGGVLAVGPLVAALAGVPAGRIVDRHGARGAGAAGLIAMALGACLLALLPLRAGIAGWIVPLAVLTAGYALFQAANNTAVMEAAGDARRGVVAGLANLARHLGLIVGSALLGAVFAPGARGTAQEVAAAAHATFAVGALLPLLALGAARVGRAVRR
jgi:MFS family permease